MKLKNISQTLAVALVVGAVAFGAAPAFAQTPGPLFADASNSPGSSLTPHTAVVRSRLVALDSAQLIDSPATLAQAPLELFLNLFYNVSVTARMTSIEANPSGSVSWSGSVVEDPMGSVVLVSRDGVTVGSVRAHGKMYSIQYAGGGVHAIEEIDEDSPMMQEIAPTAVELDPAKLSGPGPARQAAAGTVDFDLMVLYTESARVQAGGTVGIQNLIDLGVTETNQSYSNSNVNVRVNLVHTEEVTYSESGSIATDRNRLRIQGDGFLEEAHTLRDTHQADIVKLVTGYTGGGCGIAYIMTVVDTSFEEFGFCVTDRRCISPNYTFAHELGHIQSARHDYDADPTVNSPFAYNHGYYHSGSVWRTVMSYNNCPGAPCQRQLYWSNPNVMHPVTNSPMGIPDGQPQAAHNQLTLDNTATTVAAFRDNGSVFRDGFESGDTTGWDGTGS